LVDLGMGRGRDLIYFARRGFWVCGFDVDPVAIGKARRRASRYGIPVRAEVGDLRTLRLKGKFHVVFSSTSVNHLPPRVRAGRFGHFKRATLPGGIHAINAFILARGLAQAPDLDPGTMLYRPRELAGYYRDWDLIESRELRFECRYGGTLHEHAVDVIVARKPKWYGSGRGNRANRFTTGIV
jgi:tellurite methyltransferase